MTETSFVYVIGAEGGSKKIGISKNPKKRLYTLQNASPVRLSAEFFGSCSSQIARSIEAAAHAELEPVRLSGEWFNTDTATAISAIKKAAADLGLKLHVEPTSNGRAITGTQIRMARAAVGWSTRQLAAKAEIHHNTVSRIEKGEAANKGTLLLIRQTLEAAGVEFIEENGGGPGVRLVMRAAD